MTTHLTFLVANVTKYKRQNDVVCLLYWGNSKLKFVYLWFQDPRPLSIKSKIIYFSDIKRVEI